MLAHPTVKQAMERFEKAALFIDGHTPDEDANASVQAKKLGTTTIPAYYVIDPRTEKVITGTAEGSMSRERFLEVLSQAK
ncbi:hypothetical protein HY251_08500 [bacterium]|nr:hypothetical protein [bacterium]